MARRLASEVLGVITKEHVADSVALSVWPLHISSRQVVSPAPSYGVLVPASTEAE
jgi:hypothetical protein